MKALDQGIIWAHARARASVDCAATWRTRGDKMAARRRELWLELHQPEDAAS